MARARGGRADEGGQGLPAPVLVAVVMSVALLLLFLGLRRVWTVDYWWQWKTGEYVAQQGIPRTDVFSYTNYGHPRVEVRWGYCLALYLLTSAFGHGAAVVAKTALLLLAFGIAAWTALSPMAREARVRAAPLTAAVTAVACLASSQRFYERPETLSYALLIAFVAVVDRARRGPTRWVWVLPALQVIWVNSHGLFLLGPGVIGAWLVEEIVIRIRLRGSGGGEESRRLRTAAAVLAATAVASFVNPFLHRAPLLSLWQLLALRESALKGFQTEMSSPFSFEEPFTALLYYEILIGLAVAAGVARWKRQSVFWLLLLFSQFLLSASAIRNLPLFCLVAVPFVVRGSIESPLASRAWRRRFLPAAGWVLAAATVALSLYQVRELVTDRFALKQGDTNQFGIGVAENRFPIEAAKFLRDAKATGPLFNPPGLGSYFIAAGFRVFIDPRGEEHSERIIGEYRDILDHPDRIGAYAERYGFRIAVVGPDQVSLVLALRDLPRWRMVYADPVAVIFLHEEAAPQVPALDLSGPAGERWFEAMRARLGPPVRYDEAGWLTRLESPVPYMSLFHLCYVLGEMRFAQAFNQWGYEAYPPAFRS